jgi:hypothetical protein
MAAYIDGIMPRMRPGPKRNPANYRPASGQPASGWPASGLPAMGPGWGGPPKGKGRDSAALKPRTREKRENEEPAKRQVREELAQEAFDALVTIVRTSKHEGAILQAAVAILNRVEGLPVARTIAATTDDLERLTDEELEAELARFRDID